MKRAPRESGRQDSCDALLADEASSLAGPVDFPIRVSPNRRYFVDQKGTPFFWLGTTQWQLVRNCSLDEARITLQKSRSHGFTNVLVMLLGVGEGGDPNLHGQKPWMDDDPLKPNEAYFHHVDAVLRMALDSNLVVVLTPYHQRYRKFITLDKARPWARWVARRYRDLPNIVWSLVPQGKEEHIPVVRELAAGLREGDGGRFLITCHPDPSPYSSNFVHTEDWLDFNTIQTWRDVQVIYPMVWHDYNLQPVKPVVMAEGAYEEGTEYGFEVTPLWVRRQAYYSYLAGAHHAYGHNDSWRLLPTRMEALEAPGAVQMGLLKRVFLAREEWWLLVPDQSIFATGGKTTGQVLHLACRHQDCKWVMVYLGDGTAFSVNMDKIEAAKASVFWINPATGEGRPLGLFSAGGVREFSTPEGWQDAILILQASGG